MSPTLYTFLPGSSPRMRGAPRMADGAHGPGRIIPADAGSTNDIYIQRVSVVDHPRGCEEHTAWGTSYPSSPGSSPRMRGAPSDVTF